MEGDGWRLEVRNREGRSYGSGELCRLHVILVDHILVAIKGGRCLAAEGS